MTNQELLMSHISKLSEDEISSLLDTVTVMLQEKEPAPKPAGERTCTQTCLPTLCSSGCHSIWF